MSIQLVLNGHIFSPDILKPADPQCDSVSIEVISPKTILIPQEYFNPETVDAHLHLNGIYPEQSETTVFSQDRQAGIVAVTVIPKVIVESVHSQYGPKAEFTTPLLQPEPCAGAVVWMHVIAGLVFVKVWNSGLKYAEVLPCENTDELLYYLSTLDGAYRLDSYRIIIKGSSAKESAKVIKKHFKQVVCE